MKPGETSLLVQFSGVTAFPENDNKQDVERIAKAFERMRLKNKRKRRAKKELKKQLEAAEKNHDPKGLYRGFRKENRKNCLNNIFNAIHLFNF